MNNSVLVVDDDPDTLFETVQILKNDGYEVFEASSGDECLHLLKRRKPDLILLNTTLPDISGQDICRIIKADKTVSRTMVLLVSDKKNKKKNRADGFDEGADGHLTRPLSPRELVAGIRSFLKASDSKKTLLDEKEWFAGTLSSIGEGIVVTDDRCRVQFMNCIAEELTGWSAQEAAGKLFSDVVRLSDAAHPARPDDPAMLVLRSSTTVKSSDDVVIASKNGSRVHVMFSGSPILSGPGRAVSGAVLVFHDISERIAARRKNEELSRQLLECQKMESIGKLAGGMAHGFNNILTVILGNAQIEQMNAQASGRQQSEEISEIISASEKAKELINKLLAFAQKQPIVPKNIRVSKIMNDLSTMLRRMVLGIIKMQLDIRQDPVVFADENQLFHALLNVCGNACEAMSLGGTLTMIVEQVRIDSCFTSLDPDCVPGDYCRISISDTGTGIMEEHMARIMEPFFSTKPTGESSGLGLPVAHGIIKSHKGFTRISSDYGKGTTIEFHIPVSNSTEEPVEEKSVADTTQKTRGTVLVVDDEKKILKMTAKMISAEGYDVVTADGGDKALKIYRERQSDISVVVLDMMMPDMDGAEVYARLKSLNPDVRVLFASGFGIDNDTIKNLKQGSEAFLPKPFNRQALLSAIEKLLK